MGRSVRTLAPGVVLCALPLAAAPPCPPPDPTALNLNWAATDANGFPRNPWWVAQDASSAAVDPADRCSCGGFPVKSGVPNGDPPCTEQGVPDVPRGIHKITCMLEWFVDGRTGVTRGHINWFPVVVTGRAYYDHHSGPDDDVNFEVVPDTAAPNGGVPGQTKWNPSAGKLGRPDSLHVEMKKAETLAFVSQKWWSDFAAAGEAEARAKVNGSRAVVVGLFGLDAEHKGHSEVHPAYALAFQTQCRHAAGRVTETWALFVRNYGNEGWCSRWKDWHRLPLDDNRALVVQLPLASPAATLEPGALELFSNPEVQATAVVQSSGATADVRVAWSPLAASQELRVHGEVTFSWQPASPGPACPAVGRDLGRPRAPAVDEAEAWLEDLLRRAASARALPSRAKPAPDVAPVPAGTGALGPFERTGPCPKNAATCDEALRARVLDAFFTAAPRAALAEARYVDPLDAALCDAARASLPEYARAAAGKTVETPEAMRLRRTEALVSACEVEVSDDTRD